jgi:ankyrin repeat protein
MDACATGQEPLIRCLLENGAKVDVRDSNFNHPLFYIMNIDSENFDAAELIIERMQTVSRP